MTIVYLQPDGVAITAQAERQGSAALHGGGAGRPLGGRSGFRVDTPSNILTATSTTWTLVPCSAMLDPGASTHQGMYGWSTDANVTGSVTAADATYTRKDIVYITVNDSSAGDGSGATTAPVAYLAGTPSASPVAPTLPARSFLVGTITVPQTGGGSPTVVVNPARYVAAGGVLPVFSVAERDALTAYDGLTVRRMDVTGRPTETHDGTTWNRGEALRHVEFTYNVAAPNIPNGLTWGPGTLTLDSGAVSTDTALATSPSADKLTLNKGTYAIWFGGNFGNVTTGTSWFQIKDSADAVVHASGAASEYWGSVSMPNFRVTADNTTLWFRLKWTSGGTTGAAGRIRVTRIS